MRPAAVVLGVLLAMTGAVWVGQGLGYIKGSFMTGSAFWLWTGVVCLIAGLALAGSAAWARRTPAGPAPPGAPPGD